jgi:hypothetical protein
MTVEELLTILSTLSAILVAIQAYLVYRVDRAKLRLESYLGITEKSELTIKPVIQAGPNEVIVLTNNGLIPIEELEAKIDMTISRKKQPDTTQFHLEWERKTILSPKEVAILPLYEKLNDFFEEKKLMTTEEFEFPSEDPETGEGITDSLSVARLVKPFSVMLQIEVKSSLQGQTKTTKKKFKLNYNFIFEPIPDYEPDYRITVYEHMGEWKT